MNCVLIIAALEPPPSFPGLVREMTENHFDRVLVVDDGSGPAWRHIFTAAAAEGATVLCHPRNQGKGAALKTAFRHCLAHTAADFVITVDCDGQHKIDDIKKVFYTLEEFPSSLVLGVRRFDETTPKRSLLGNRTASFLAKSLYGITVNDTQTGLRGIPWAYLDAFLNVRGERYEYELNVVIDAVKQGIPLAAAAVEAVYIDDNALSHYRPWADSFRIARAFVTNLGRRS